MAGGEGVPGEGGEQVGSAGGAAALEIECETGSTAPSQVSGEDDEVGAIRTRQIVADGGRGVPSEVSGCEISEADAGFQHAPVQPGVSERTAPRESPAREDERCLLEVCGVFDPACRACDCSIVGVAEVAGQNQCAAPGLGDVAASSQEGVGPEFHGPGGVGRKVCGSVGQNVEPSARRGIEAGNQKVCPGPVPECRVAGQADGPVAIGVEVPAACIDRGCHQRAARKAECRSQARGAGAADTHHEVLDRRGAAGLVDRGVDGLGTARGFSSEGDCCSCEVAVCERECSREVLAEGHRVVRQREVCEERIEGSGSQTHIPVPCRAIEGEASHCPSSDFPCSSGIAQRQVAGAALERNISGSPGKTHRKEVGLDPVLRTQPEEGVAGGLV